jgi:CHASE3 domain sensor protein
MEFFELLKGFLFFLFIVFLITVYHLLVLQISRGLNDLIDNRTAKKKRNTAVDGISSAAKRIEKRAEDWMRKGHEKEDL